MEEFYSSRKNYGARKLKVVLERNGGLRASRRKIGGIPAKYRFVSSYAKKHFKSRKAKCNEGQN